MFGFINSLFKTNQQNASSAITIDTGTISKYQKEFDVNNIDTIDAEDFLGLAANAHNRAKAEIEKKNYEKAWELFTKKQHYYYQHAEKQNFTTSQTIALAASISEDFANILRLEKNHKQALVHFIYCVADEYPNVKYKAKKLPAYLNRAKLKNVNLKELENFIYSLSKPPNYRTIQDKVKAWMKDYKSHPCD